MYQNKLDINVSEINWTSWYKSILELSGILVASQFPQPTCSWKYSECGGEPVYLVAWSISDEPYDFLFWSYMRSVYSWSDINLCVFDPNSAQLFQYGFKLPSVLKVSELVGQCEIEAGREFTLVMLKQFSVKMKMWKCESLKLKPR